MKKNTFGSARQIMRRLAGLGSIALLVGSVCECQAADIVYDTAPYFPIATGSLSFGPDEGQTVGQTFLAPHGSSVTLNNFSFYARSYYPPFGVATLTVRPFVYGWSGNLDGQGGGTSGQALYLGPSFQIQPPPRQVIGAPGQEGGWVPLSVDFGDGIQLAAGQQYVMGFALSGFSVGDVELQIVPARNPSYSPPPIPEGVDFGGGSAVWLLSTALNTSVWDTWGDIGTMAFTADFTVIPGIPDLSNSGCLLAGTSVLLLGVQAVCRRLKRKAFRAR